MAPKKENNFAFISELVYKDGTTKGNCDAELVLQAMIEYPNYKKAVIITGDGDFYFESARNKLVYRLVKYLIENRKLKSVLIPDRYKFSTLLKFKSFRPYLRYMNELKDKLAYKKKRPRKDGTL